MIRDKMTRDESEAKPPVTPAARAVTRMPAKKKKKAGVKKLIAAAKETQRLFNREYSWLAFNRRVLCEAEDPAVPLLERLKFLSIASNNLDEFLMVRLGGIADLISAGLNERSHDGLTPKQQLKGIRERTTSLLRDMYACLDQSVLPQLEKHGIRIEKFEGLNRKEQQVMREHYDRNISPILTPLAIDPGHPFPFLTNLALNLAITLASDRGEEHTVFLKIPPLLPRFVEVPDTSKFVPVESLISAQLGRFFPGLNIKSIVPFRVIRNSDISLREDEVQDLLLSVESELRRRERKQVVWIEIGVDADEALLELLTSATKAARGDIFFTPGLPKLSDLMQIYAAVGKPTLRDEPFNPRIPSTLASADDIFSIIRRQDVLLHRPYDSYSAVVEFVQSAAADPDVLVIKQTLYRTDEGSPVVEALIQAAQQGKQVTAVVELQARFDELKNIAWARRLEDAGVQVVYGLVGVKTHCKLVFVVRREGQQLQRYLHLSTGNYNSRTARVYTDIDLFTCDERMTDDASKAFNLITGFSVASAQEIFDRHGPALDWNQMVVSPIDYQNWVIEMIEREITHVRAGRESGLVIKLNALVDPTVIQKLYEASEAGVKIELLIRGICCLVPGVEGMSSRIRVISMIDRYLEHSRIMLFRNGGAAEIFESSGDWMPRNFIRRIEITFPILAPALKQRIEKEILSIAMQDTVKSWELRSDGRYERIRRSGTPLRSQSRFIEIARAEAVRIGPYDEMIKKPASFRRKARRPKKKEK